MAGHISDDDLERYAMSTVKDEAEIASLEEHLQVIDSRSKLGAE